MIEAHGHYIPDLTEQIVINQWYPEHRPVHCSNCVNAVVTVVGPRLIAHCRQGHGHENRRTMPYTRLMRLRNAGRFLDAKTCPDFSTMDDE